MPISFEYIPNNVLLPLFYAEVTAAAEPFQPNLRLCLIGHQNKNTPGSAQDGYATANWPYNLTGTTAQNIFGRGSMLHWMYDIARENCPFGEIWGVALPEIAGAIKATGKIQVVKPASQTRQGMCAFFIAGRRTEVRVRPTDTAEIIAKNIQIEINKKPLPVKASGADGTTGKTTINITCMWAGVTGNEIRMSWIGPRGRGDWSEPAIVLGKYLLNIDYSLSGGAGEAEVGQALGILAERPFDVFVAATTNQAQLDALQDFMDNAAGRWSPSLQMYGHCVTTRISNFQNLYDLGVARNDPHLSIMGVKQSVQPSWEWSGALGGIMITHWAAPPELSRPLQTLELRKLSVGSDDDESFDSVERQQLLTQGISTFHVDRDTTCRIDRIRTTRKYNLYGDPDPSWADAVTMFQCMYFVRAMRAAITGAFPRAALTDEPSGINGFTSAQEIEMVVIHEYGRQQSLGLVEHQELFAQYLVCERDQVDRNRVNILMRPDFVNQLRVVAALVETHLELDPSSPLLNFTTDQPEDGALAA